MSRPKFCFNTVSSASVTVLSVKTNCAVIDKSAYAAISALNTNITVWKKSNCFELHSSKTVYFIKNNILPSFFDLHITAVINRLIENGAINKIIILQNGFIPLIQ